MIPIWRLLMSKPNAPSLAPEADPTIIASITGLLAHDIRAANDAEDLERRLSRKGYCLTKGYLATAPHGKLICPLAQLGLR